MQVKAVVLSLSAIFSGIAFADSNTVAQAQIDQLQAQINQLQSEVANNASLSTTNGKISMLSETVNRGVFTDYSSPFGLLPDTSLSYTLLQQQSQFNQSPIVIGGSVEADFQAWAGGSIPNYTLPGDSTATALAVTGAQLHVLGNLNDWTQAYITLKGGLNGNDSTISDAFITFGNLSKNPLFATVGNTYVPFGIFAGNGPWSNNLLTNAFRSNELAQVIFGYGKNGLNTNISVFNSNDHTSDFAYSLQYGNTVDQLQYSLGGGYLNDVRYSGSGIGGAYANNTATSTASPLVGKRNGALDVNGSVSYNFSSTKALGLSGEYISTTLSAQYNGVDTGKMRAWNTTATYSLPIYDKNTQFGLGYSATINMQNVPMPLAASVANASTTSIPGLKNQWLGYVSSEVLNNIYVGPEYAHVKLYNGNSTWATTVDVLAYF